LASTQTSCFPARREAPPGVRSPVAAAARSVLARLEPRLPTARGGEIGKDITRISQINHAGVSCALDAGRWVRGPANHLCGTPYPIDAAAKSEI
jgi:hypothetical protein